MKTELACLPCFFRQVERTLSYAGVNGDRGRTIARQAGQIVEDASLDDIPARVSTRIHRLIRETAGVDPYQRAKEQTNRLALERLPRLRMRAESSPDRLQDAVRIAIAGNVIDFGIYDTVDLDLSIEQSFSRVLDSGAVRRFSDAVHRSRNILYLCDNAGEIVFDRVLIEALQDLGKTVTVSVKGAPVINDATMDDAAAAGLAGAASVIDNGSDGIGTLLESCSPRFREAYQSADMIISKGQANFETLIGEADPRIHFLFKVKCSVVGGFLGREEGDIILTSGANTGI